MLAKPCQPECEAQSPTELQYLLLDVVKRIGGVDRETDEDYVGIRVRKRAETIVILLTSRIPKSQLHVLSIDLYIGHIVLEDGWDIDLSSHNISLAGVPLSGSSHCWVIEIVLFVSAIPTSC
jgi:hypothetical protein